MKGCAGAILFRDILSTKANAVFTCSTAPGMTTEGVLSPNRPMLMTRKGARYPAAQFLGRRKNRTFFAPTLTQILQLRGREDFVWQMWGVEAPKWFDDIYYADRRALDDIKLDNISAPRLQSRSTGNDNKDKTAIPLTAILFYYTQIYHRILSSM